MRIAVEGCAHGELEIIYATLQEIEKSDSKKIDLLICCGDFQSTRNLTDLSCMAVPDKYKEMCSFYKYYSGEKLAPVLTLFIGGNHEASNYLQELPYGGWVAPNIYYLGYAGVVNIAGVRIAGISGIYKSQDWMQGRHERVPYNSSTIRSVYHVRNLEVFRLKQLSGNVDIFLSHDWPRGITQYGDERALLRNKPLFKNDIEANVLGNPACMELLLHHCPSYWFSAHLHCKFAALVAKKNEETDENTDESGRVCRFLALDKCLPKRKFLQIVEISHKEESPIELTYDLEWLAILYLTNHLLSVKRGSHYMPGQGGTGRWIYTPTDNEKTNVLKRFDGNLRVPENFVKTAEPWDPEKTLASSQVTPSPRTNPQTTLFCNKLGIDDPEALLQIISGTKDNSRTDCSFEKVDSKDDSFILDDDNFMSSTLEDDDEAASSEDSSERISLLPNLSPEYVNKINQDETSLTEERSTVKNLNELFAESKDKNIQESKDLEAVIDRVGENVTTVTECQSTREKVNTEPNCKKFKRRNHSMYSNTV